MSVLIKGMDKETAVRICAYTGVRMDDSDFVPVPPHGRLIDADALMEIIKAHDYPLRAHFNSTDNGMFTIGIQQAVNDAPTIIPAEPLKEEE